jgi:hypothetical protein
VKKEDQAREFFLRLIKDYELEVHPGRVPVVRRVLLRQGRDGRGPQVLRKVEQFPKSASTPTPSTKGWCYVTWATSRPPSRPSWASCA